MQSARAGSTAERPVRLAQAADLHAIVALEREAFSDPWSLRSFTDLLASSAAWFAVATAEGGAGIDGFVIALHSGDEAEIANIAVRADRRGTGVGAALLDAAIRHVESVGARELFLEVRESNLAARRLYEQRDFAEVGRRPRYYRSPLEDALVLRRTSRRGETGAESAAAPAVGGGA